MDSNEGRIIVSPQIVPGSPLMVVGEAPGRQEEQWHICQDCSHAGVPLGGRRCAKCGLSGNLCHSPSPFVGASGRILNWALKEVGIKREATSISNVCLWRPKDFRQELYVTTTPIKGKRKLRPIQVETEELLLNYARLANEIEAVCPSIIVAMGAEAARTLVGSTRVEAGITKIRGSVYESTLVPMVPVLCEVHPAWILRGSWKYLWVLLHDFKRAVAPVLAGKPWTADAPTYITNPTVDQALEILDRIRHDRARWSLDIETRGDGVACVGVASQSTGAICIPLQTTKGAKYKAWEEVKIWQALGVVFAENPNLVGQNLAYDLEWLFDYGVEPSAVYMDTMLGHALAYPEFPKGLDFIVSWYTNGQYYKDEAKAWNSKTSDQDLWRYNCKDAWYTLVASYEIEHVLQTFGLWEFYSHYTNRLLGMALEMQRARLPVARRNLEALGTLLREAVKETHEALHNELGAGDDTINVASPKQVAKWIYGKLQIQPLPRRKQATDENTLRDLYAREKNEALKLIITERHLQKRISSYANVELDPDGALPFMVNIAGTETGRWSMSKSPRRHGLNAQTLPEVMRYMVEPPPGRIFIQADLSQAEARIVAWLANCAGLIELFSDPTRSVHLENAARIFGHPVAKGSAEYRLAKAAIHASNYMMQPARLASEAGIDVVRAKTILETYHALYPEIRQWHELVRAQVLTEKELRTSFGRSRVFYEAMAFTKITGGFSDEAWREAVAYVPQATVPDITNKAALKLWNKYPSMLFHHQGHDSIVISIPVEQSNFASILGSIQDTLAIPLTLGSTGIELVIPAEVAIGYNWYLLVSPASFATRSTAPTYSEWWEVVKERAAMDKIRAELVGTVWA